MPRPRSTVEQALRLQQDIRALHTRIIANEEGKYQPDHFNLKRLKNQLVKMDKDIKALQAELRRAK